MNVVACESARVKAIFQVQTVNRDSGAENWVRVEAASSDDARRRVMALGEIVGEVRLIEVLDSVASISPAIPGVITCPKCGGTKWEGGRGCVIWALVILLFPIGLLLLFIRPTFRCRGCRYSYASYSAPVEIERTAKPLTLLEVVGVVLVAGLLIMFLLGALGI